MSVEVDSAARGVRVRVRAELTREILDVARDQLAKTGARALSLRAVARDLGMVSSAIYRYFPSREDLLTALIIDAYESVGAAAHEAERAVPRRDLAGRWTAICQAVRGWARANPQQYALVYGSPVIGYAAPQDTVAAATRVTELLVGVLRDLSPAPAPTGVAQPRPTVEHAAVAPALPPAVYAAVAPALAFMGPRVSPDLAARGLMAWTWLFGWVSMELFGHLVGVVADADALFAHEADRMGRVVGVGDVRPA